jgi:hypothetical protein
MSELARISQDQVVAAWLENQVYDQLEEYADDPAHAHTRLPAELADTDLMRLLTTVWHQIGMPLDGLDDMAEYTSRLARRDVQFPVNGGTPDSEMLAWARHRLAVDVAAWHRDPGDALGEEGVYQPNLRDRQLRAAADALGLDYDRVAAEHTTADQRARLAEILADHDQ